MARPLSHKLPTRVQRRFFYQTTCGGYQVMLDRGLEDRVVAEARLRFLGLGPV